MQDIPHQPPVISDIVALRAQVEAWQQSGLRVGLVPTMGALHPGHLSLVEQIAQEAERIIVSVFVNPKQFGAHEDLAAYPRTLDADRQALAGTSAHLIYAPAATVMYPCGFATHIEVGGLSEAYEGENRPGHFRGVATVVAKLLLQSRADVAIFGEKDYQQLAVIRHMVKDLDIECKILAGTLYREADGLAASSRNRYLDANERKTAAALPRALSAALEAVAAGSPPARALDDARRTILAAGFDRVDYLCLVHPDTLKPLPADYQGRARLIAAARIGETRLLDNMPAILPGE